jgi:D-3-phosphoglycerate dehydrogenase
MNNTNEYFQAVLIGHDEALGPLGWVKEELASNQIDWAVANSWSEAETLANSRDADVVLTMSGRRLLTRLVIEQLEKCRAIVRVGSGVDCIDLPAATERGIVVINTPDAVAEEVADHTIALLLEAVRRVAWQDRLVRQGKWRSVEVFPTRRVRGMTLGLIGFGHVARAVVEKLSGWKMVFLAYDPYLGPETGERLGVRLVGLNELLEQSDVVSLHAPLTEKTYHLLGDEEFRRMKPGAIFINTARGAEVDEQALLWALHEGHLSAAGLDVLEHEPPSPDHPLLQLDNVTFTPHTAACSDEAQDAMFRAACHVVSEILQGRLPECIVIPEVKPWWLTNPPG